MSLDKAIAIVERNAISDNILNMDVYQEYGGLGDVVMEEHHSCGTICCLAGFIAISPEFQADGGYVSSTGAPRMGGKYNAASSIASWLGIPLRQAEILCCVSGEDRNLAYKDRSVHKITWAEVSANLYALRDTGKLLFEE